MTKKLIDITTTPFRGGNVTRNEPALLPPGGFSKIQNMRQRHPGLEQRGGMAKLHTTATASKILSMFQFSKGKSTERHTYAQRGDDDVWEATTAPPGVTTGAFGSKVFTGSGSSIPASWSVLDDTLFFSNGVDQHQIYPGTGSYVKRLIVYKGAAAIPTIPILGEDYSDEVSDGLTSTAAILDSLSTLAAYDCIFIMTPVPADTLTWTISKPNGTASAAQMKYRKSDDTWAAVDSLVDNTKDDSKAFATTGATMTWTLPTDSIPSYMFGEAGYWYQLSLASGALDAETEVTAVTYETDWQSIENVWDGVPVPVIETQFFDSSATIYKKFGSVSIEIDSMAVDIDLVHFATLDKTNAIYVDVGSKPNTTASTVVEFVYYWNGAAFATVGTISDGTNGLSNSGWITFPRVAAMKTQFNKNQYYAYWYYFRVSETLNDDVIISLSYQPYFDIADFGKGYCNCAWKDRMVYGFDKDQYLFVSAKGRPQVLNGDDFGILDPGDGRKNKPVVMKKFHNELMVWQEEKGVDGGCLTLFEGYSPATFGKLVLSTRIGCLNAKCAEVIDGVKIGTKTDEIITTAAFWLSNYGVFMSNGQYVHDVSRDIENYFDPQKTECIRTGYEKDHWLSYDASENTINIGLVSGTSASVPNVFLILDLEDLTWSFDSRTPALSCMTNIEAGSGNKPIIQIGGGVADGFAYLLSTTTNDVAAAIDAYATIEVSGKGRNVHIDDGVVRTKVQTAGNLTLTPYINTIAQTAKTLSMTAEIATQTIRRHRKHFNLTGQHLSFKFQNNTASQSLYLLDYGLEIKEYENQ